MSTLLQDISRYPVGTKITIATSQYAENTTAPGFHFDLWSSAPAVRGLITRGFLKGQCGWRYYDVEIIKHEELK